MALPVWAIVVAAGQGTRFGGPKQLEEIDGKTVLDHSMLAARSSADGVVAVVAARYVGEEQIASLADRVVAGAVTRAGSVRAGLAAVPEDAEVIVVHDAARPLASRDLFEAVVSAVRDGADGAIPGHPMVDTVKQAKEGIVVGTLDRAGLVRVETPQAYAAKVLRRAHESGAESTDDAALVEADGGRVVVVPGELWNLKITTPDDLELARWWYERRRAAEVLR
ncbi:MAG: 2-C-methyl-D-erythritol 4-phosphate cytidylyltransferase [Acidimicrobiales bacterium]